MIHILTAKVFLGALSTYFPLEGTGINQYSPKFNMAPENNGFQKESPFPKTSFQVPC